jgi:uncharacterized RDD family membrane protein YckC
LNATRWSALTIRTPEGVLFSLPLAGPASRMLACVVDFAVIAAASSVLGGILNAFGALSRDLATALVTLCYFGVSIGYGIVMEWAWRGQTIGKRLLRLRVVDARGLKLQFHQVVIRNLLRYVDRLPLFYLVGGVSMLASRRSQRLGDIAAGTVVVRLEEAGAPDLARALQDKYNSLRSHPRVTARLRQRVSPGEAAVALQALLRRDRFEPGPRVRLFAELAAHFRGLADFPPETVEEITDEQLVRNVVDVVFSARS